MVQEQVAELEAKLAKLTAEFNAANNDKQEVLATGFGHGHSLSGCIAIV